MLLLRQSCVLFAVFLSLIPLLAASTACDCGFGYELIQQRLDNIETRLLNVRERPESCLDATRNASGIYQIQPRFSSKPFPVYCDMIASSGGWTVFQSRYNGVVNFTKQWQEYRDGFGILGSEYWMGLERLHQLTTSDPHELIVYVKFDAEEYSYAHYSEFRIDGEQQKYALSKLGSYSGTAGDYLRYHEGKPFSTYGTSKSCPSYKGGWWFDNCYTSYLNGQYSKNDSLGIKWGTANPTPNYSRMMIRKK